MSDTWQDISKDTAGCWSFKVDMLPAVGGTLRVKIDKAMSWAYLEGPTGQMGKFRLLPYCPEDVLQVEHGSLYPALHRLEQKRWLKAQWKQSETGREAKFYSLTNSGRKQLAVERNSWARLSGAVQLIFDEENG